MRSRLSGFWEKDGMSQIVLILVSEGEGLAGGLRSQAGGCVERGLVSLTH